MRMQRARRNREALCPGTIAESERLHWHADCHHLELAHQAINKEIGKTKSKDKEKAKPKVAFAAVETDDSADDDFEDIDAYANKGFNVSMKVIRVI